MAPKSGFCDENSVVRHVKSPGPLREAAGLYYQEFSNVKTIPLLNDPFSVGPEKNIARDWIEFLIPETAKSRALYDDPFFGKYPAVTENKFGKGSFIYEGCLLTDDVQTRIVANKALEIGLLKKGEEITYPIVVKSGTNDTGKTIHFYLNYSGEQQKVIYRFNNGRDIIDNKPVVNGDNFILLPWDLKIVEE